MTSRFYLEIDRSLITQIKISTFAPYFTDMQKALIYFALGTVVSFLINYFFLSSDNMGLELYYAVAFGAAWGIAYYLDTPDFTLPKKLGLSFLAMAILVLIGTLLFKLELAIPSILKFSMVFVAYYVIASFRATKSLRK
ncbi:hypothetical protein [Chryseobacterium sp. G0162]|uniref:hypothetical protein n=1 Tax=Chryseobacterium sp. G0162 TaxID=2487063 RepID=UPI002696601E|nr:hypothetical protein [Chryseobacterium sp. G0162]